MNVIFWDYESVWHKFDLKINVGNCDIFHGPVILPYISWRLFDIWTPYFGIMSQYDPMFDLKHEVKVMDFEILN